MSQTSTRVYVAGTMDPPKVRNKGGAPQVYKHFGSRDKLYYQSDGKYYCACDDKPARGYVVKDHNGTDRFLPLDFTDLISYDAARRMCEKSGVHFPQPGHKNYGHRVPPPLLVVSTPLKSRPVWNRDAINRHIEECQRRKQNARLR